MSTRGLFHRLLPAPLNIPFKECVRASIGALLGLLLAGLACSQAFGATVALHLLGPLAASAVLLFAVHSGALAQPWPFVGSYACATVVGLALHHWFGSALWVAALALGLAIVVMCLLRCLHPPGGGVAVSVVLADSSLASMGNQVFEPIMLNALVLVAVAVIYNRLTGVRYPKTAAPRKDLHHTADTVPAERVGVSGADLDHALEELGEFVDVTRDELERIILATEQHALQRSLGGITAASVMSRDVQQATPKTTLQEAWQQLSSHHLKTLPVLDETRRLVGIVSLSDLVGPAMAQSRFSWRGLFGRQPKVVLEQIMSRPVVTVRRDEPAVALIPLLSEQGLHCLPVMDGEQLVGVITQTDLIAGLKRHVLSTPARSDDRVPAL
ncbi:HPP family protein [Pseudomonas sp. JQ170]|uniref:HPP family protein n=1 Tax=unclassified Pseudomonas TaxID=196821 RepID=UPI002656EAAA|nr:MULTISPECIES: HPP family protein [unclassified Pseudomonas]MDN7141968.1 HPP family protein [Pseudomonas sp. JQ170]WRO78266.1 HPP family protein [Pseudomonas sp. 170C]